MHRPIPALLFALAGIVPLAAGCTRPEVKTEKTVTPVAAKPAVPDIDFAKIRPNELGYIPVIMYHEIGGTPSLKDPHLVRSVESFKKDLELMYAAGFRPVNLSDVLENNLDLPAGKSPIVLTFDDARASQFRLIETPDAMKVDPNCAVGILQEFNKKYPDWPLRATFFVLPRSELTLEPFGQPGLGDQKMNYLVENGMEIGNHTIHHRSMRDMTPEQIQAEIGGAHNRILQAVPNAKINVVALPMGQYPKNKENWRYLVKGTFEGKSYEYKGAMKAAYQAVPSPASTKFDPMTLERIGPADVRWGVRWWIETLSQNGRYPRYVSDGDPNVISFPKGSESLVNTARLQAENKTLYAYSPFGGGGGAKPIVGAGATEPEAASPKPITGG